MSSHAAPAASWTSRLIKSGEPLLLRVAFGTAGAAVTAGIAGIVALASW
jgi:hypothetical protein